MSQIPSCILPDSWLSESMKCEERYCLRSCTSSWEPSEIGTSCKIFSSQIHYTLFSQLGKSVIRYMKPHVWQFKKLWNYGKIFADKVILSSRCFSYKTFVHFYRQKGKSICAYLTTRHSLRQVCDDRHSIFTLFKMLTITLSYFVSYFSLTAPKTKKQTSDTRMFWLVNQI